MPQLLPPSLAALAGRANNAGILQGLDSDVNVGSLSNIFDGPAAGHVPTAWEQYSGDRVADAAEEAMGAGPSVDAFRRLARAQKLQNLEDRGMDEADFLAHGLDRGLTHANVQNQVGDVLSEGAAGRQMLPNASALRHENFANEQDLAEARYLLPAQIKAQGDLAAAAAQARGRVDAATANRGDASLRGFYNAIQALLEKGGVSDLTPEAIAQLRTLYSQNAQ